MAVYNVRFYDYNPQYLIPSGTGSSFTWSGPSAAVGKATITDNEFGSQGYTLDDDNSGGESATAWVQVGNDVSTYSNVDAEIAWTVTDNVTGQTFQIVQFEVENGSASGYYTLSEIPLVAGRSYTVNDYDSNPNVQSNDPVFSAQDYEAPDAVISGTSGNDSIDGSYTGDPENDQVDDGFAGGSDGNDNVIEAGGGNDTVEAGLGDDSVDGGSGADSIVGGDGADTLEGGSGNDTIFGDNAGGTPAGDDEYLDWSAQGGDGTNVASGFTQNTGDTDVSVSFTNDGNNNPTFNVETSDDVYVGSGEGFDDDSNLYLYGNGGGATSSAYFEFSAASGAAVTGEVQDVSFRINDIDSYPNNHVDIITINAYDADGNAVTVTITPSGDDTVDGNTITAGSSLDDPDESDGSALVEIAGPVSRIEISYSNGHNLTQAIYVSDVHFTTIPDVDELNADVIDGGLGDDVIDGEEGADTITGGEGDDTMTGGEGNDTFVIGAGDGNDVITDFDTSDEDGDGQFADQLDLSGLTDAEGGSIESWDIAITDDGSGNAVLTFPNGESITLMGVTPDEISGAENLNAAGVPCFAAGTLIRTPTGDVPVESLHAGDLVETRDHGPQRLIWTGQRHLDAEALLAEPQNRPVVIPEGVLDNNSPLVVSPQHGMLLDERHGLPGERLVRAKHLAEAPGPVRVANGKRQVTYHHLMFAAHQVIFANGTPSESFYPGPQSLKMYPAPVLAQLTALVPDLGVKPVETAYGPTARIYLKRREALELVDLRGVGKMASEAA
ncbi:Hint domain-containing protein [Pseudoruegeria sp. HB172150]|uniref:Hint domain-containing protein n=1 Tax=Pseudoruegeria sp. HB172150 TaxID=2721164 RepID=UPI001556EEEC|nr:Hint domain-containing protein [Pseudoruegeria sp. HB172150]